MFYVLCSFIAPRKLYVPPSSLQCFKKVANRPLTVLLVFHPPLGPGSTLSLSPHRHRSLGEKVTCVSEGFGRFVYILWLYKSAFTWQSKQGHRRDTTPAAAHMSGRGYHIPIDWCGNGPCGTERGSCSGCGRGWWEAAEVVGNWLPLRQVSSIALLLLSIRLFFQRQR